MAKGYYKLPRDGRGVKQLAGNTWRSDKGSARLGLERGHKAGVSAHCAKGKHQSCFSLKCTCECGHGVGGHNMQTDKSGVVIQRMWQNGPLRQFCSGKTRPSGSFISYQSKTLTGYAGSYVCEACQKTCDGVYHIADKWLGGCCK